MTEKYRKSYPPINSTLTVVQDKDYRWGAVDQQGNVVIPFGKYQWIDGFQNGLAKVKSHKDNTSAKRIKAFGFDGSVREVTDRIAEQGIINENGVEVLPLEYNIWKFYGKSFPMIKYYKGKKKYTTSYHDLYLKGRENDLLVDDKDLIFYDLNLYIEADEEDSFNRRSLCKKISFSRFNERYDNYTSEELAQMTWDAMTDGMYGDMPEDFDGDYDF